MTRITLIILSITILSTTLWAQHINCGYDHAIEHMEQKYPGYKKSINKTFQDAKNHSTPLRSSSMVYNIPVVVHVVWNEEEEMLDDSLILSQIEILNEDFRRLNSDAENIRDIFSSVVADPMIQFTLEEVIYVKTNALFEVDIFTNELPDNVKFDDTGGSDAWDNKSYLNIWICKIQPILFAGQTLGQLLGYAYPPNDLNNWPPEAAIPDPDFDGVVLDYRTVGRDNPYDIDPGTGEVLQFTKGRSAVHEVGHYLGLRHIWGDGDPFLPNSCNFDDGIADTPNAGAQTLFICDTLQNTCSSTIDDLPDMIENFMDYSSEDCQNSFTIGQIELIRSVLENQRCQLIQLLDCSVSTSQLEFVDIDIYPNPSTGLFELRSANLDVNKFDFEIIDISGATYPVHMHTQTLDLSQFTPGIYIFRGTNEKQIFQQKLIRL